LFSVFSALCLVPARAEVKLPKVFTPHMVLQREMPVPVWGTAGPGEKVTVAFRDQTLQTEADAQGKWQVKLAPLTAGGPDVLKIGGVSLEDVLVGEVWVGSGQSNMDMLVNAYTQGDAPLAKLAAGAYPHLRFMRKEPNAKWEESSPETHAAFSAQLFAFGQALQSKLGVPVGLMVGAVGGTPSGFWLTEDMYRSDTACQELVAKMAPGYDYGGLTKKYQEAKAVWDTEMVEWKKAAELAKQGGKEAPRAPRAPQSVGKAAQLR